MLCEDCVARTKGGCFISKGSHVMCNRTEKEIKRARNVLLKSHELDDIARRYIVDKDKKAAEEWWAKLREVCK